MRFSASDGIMWMAWVAFYMCTTINTHVDCQIRYTHRPRHFEDPEPSNLQDHTKNTNLEEWKKPQRNSEFIGLMFAGRTEYNWITDIRVQDKDQELWAIGNSISSHHVLTTCRAVTNLQPFGNRVKVHYCTMWLFEEFKHYGLERKVLFDIQSKENAGELRYATQFIKYPSCSSSTVNYDLGVIIMNKAIPIYIPFIGFMPIVRDKSGAIPVDVDLNHMKVERWVCHVASFGRNFVDMQNHLVLNSKVKLRAYYADWSICQRHFPMICKNDQSCSDPNVRKDAMCLTTRAKVGSVCDHDRGAPLVCDGQVYGLVVRGAAYGYCNTVRHLPFIVLKITQLKEFHSLYDSTSTKDNPRSFEQKQRDAFSRAGLELQLNFSLIIFTFCRLF